MPLPPQAADNKMLKCPKRSNATSLTDVRCAPLFVGGGKTETDCFENTSDQAPTSPPHECLLHHRETKEANLQRVTKGDAKAGIHRMEIDRIRFVLSSYLRSRLQKIEKFFPHVLEREKSRGEGDPSLLSPEEFAFAKEYYAMTETYLKAVALKRMPPNLQTVDMLKAVPEPCLDSFVFLRVKERQENILVEPETDDQREYVVDLEEGSQHLMRYRTIAPLVSSGAVQLI
ncbi:DNA replication complex GINS protein SLD5 [Larimichthys crocea]|uniref:DNA replication complex GINS protein SLD5 n=1 Tax=Larimichthys crocea TaxID=215358 RepID=UPI000F5FDF36|nr:DNA replication complex GINS protein SLD5 [Larimichthys crocea]